MTDTQPIIIKQSPNWISLIGWAVAVILLILLMTCNRKNPLPQIIKVADSALIEENRRLLEQTTIDKQYKWKTDLLLTQREELEGVIVQQTKTIVSMERELRNSAGKIIVDSADCIDLANQVNNYIDTAIVYRELWKQQGQNYQASIAFEKDANIRLRKLLDSCRSVIGIVQPAFKALKPRGVVSVGIVGGWSPVQYGIGPALMYRDKRGRSYQFSAQVTNNQQLYQGGFFVPISFRKL